MRIFKKFSRYRFYHFINPDALPWGDEAPWPSDRVFRKAGWNPEDEEVAVSELAAPWDGNPAGSLIIYAVVDSGQPFTIVRPRKKVLSCLKPRTRR
jgi:hypothetical protein